MKNGKIIASWVTCILGSLLNLVFCIAMLILVPKFEAIFRDLGIILPWPTELMISISRSYAGAFIGLAALAQIALEVKWSGSTTRIIVNGLIFLVALCMCGLLTLSMFLPCIKVTETIGSQSSSSSSEAGSNAPATPP